MKNYQEKENLKAWQLWVITQNYIQIQACYQSEDRINYLITQIAALNNLIKSKVVKQKKKGQGSKTKKKFAKSWTTKIFRRRFRKVNKKIEQVETYEKMITEMIPQIKILKLVKIKFTINPKLFSKLNYRIPVNNFQKSQKEEQKKQQKLD
ncbi:unnamed protein product [Paramecium sonneborni]|uniref:Uncharacterized protein n=1 Tax=Paramecium sonneborni TaxID=65129 RepID=A0A8S1KHK6_9CILI|nr:unnamed protein product [Paramecium sonneborni]